VIRAAAASPSLSVAGPAGTVGTPCLFCLISRRRPLYVFTKEGSGPGNWLRCYVLAARSILTLRYFLTKRHLRARPDAIMGDGVSLPSTRVRPCLFVEARTNSVLEILLFKAENRFFEKMKQD
jgi:hypothetical protein